jgi:hypothetical protein
MLAPEPPRPQRTREERCEICVNNRDGLEGPAPAEPLLFTYPPDRYGFEEALRGAKPVHEVVPRAVSSRGVGGNTTDGTQSRSRIASSASARAQSGAGISHH